MVLANRIRDCIARHMTNFTATEYKEMLASAIMALYLEAARLKWLSVSAGVEPEDFDRVFNEGIEKHFDDHQTKYGTC